MEALKNSIKNIQPNISDEELNTGIEQFELIEYNAKDHLLTAGETCDYLYFSESAIVRCFYQTEEGEEHTLWMKPEQTFLTEFKSFTGRQASGFSLQTYENSKIARIHRDKLLGLYQQYSGWAMFGIQLTEQLHVTLIDVFVNLLANDATRNYQYIQYAFPRFLQVAPLKDIASMLQVSQVTLSRIRSGTQTKN